MKQKMRFVVPVLAIALSAVPALSQNTGRTGGGNHPLATQLTSSQLVGESSASITNATGSSVTVTLDPSAEELQLQSGETRMVSCKQKVWVGAAHTRTGKAFGLACQASYQMRADDGSVEFVLTSAP